LILYLLRFETSINALIINLLLFQFAGYLLSETRCGYSFVELSGLSIIIIMMIIVMVMTETVAVKLAVTLTLTVAMAIIMQKVSYHLHVTLYSSVSLLN